MIIPTRLRPRDMDDKPFPSGRLSKLALETDDIEVRHYAPKDFDPQVPHDRDELYVVIAGHGTYQRGEERVPFSAGDLLYAAAGEEHRFVDFSADFETWVIFYGPRAG